MTETSATAEVGTGPHEAEPMAPPKVTSGVELDSTARQNPWGVTLLNQPMPWSWRKDSNSALSPDRSAACREAKSP